MPSVGGARSTAGSHSAAGRIAFGDKRRGRGMQNLGRKKWSLISGDRTRVAEVIARQAGIEEVHADLA